MLRDEDDFTGWMMDIHSSSHPDIALFKNRGSNALNLLIKLHIGRDGVINTLCTLPLFTISIES